MADQSVPISSTAPIDGTGRLWIAATSVTGSTGLVASAVPFLASLAPSARARAAGAPVEVDLQGMPLGELWTVEWRVANRCLSSGGRKTCSIH